MKEGKRTPASPQIIIPIGKYSCISRATDLNTNPKFKVVKEGSAEIFNIKALGGVGNKTQLPSPESGAIEYSSDVLLGMQFETDGEKITVESINHLKREDIRKIELKILKNRNGKTGDTITYEYYPMFNYFKETGKKLNGDTLKKDIGKRL